MNLAVFKDGIKVSNKGYIQLTDEQWDELCRHLHSSHLSHKYQKQMIKAYICGAIEVGMKEAKKKK